MRILELAFILIFLVLVAAPYCLATSLYVPARDFWNILAISSLLKSVTMCLG